MNYYLELFAIFNEMPMSERTPDIVKARQILAKAYDKKRREEDAKIM